MSLSVAYLLLYQETTVTENPPGRAGSVYGFYQNLSLNIRRWIEPKSCAWFLCSNLVANTNAAQTVTCDF